MRYLSWIFTVIYIFQFVSCKMTQTLENKTLFVGAYTDNGSNGIYSFSFNIDDGTLANKSLVAEMTNPSFLKISPNKKNLYAVSEVADFEDASGSVTAFEIENDSLIKLNTESTMGAHPCHISISEKGDLVAVSNYTGGNITLYQTEEDGSFGSKFQSIDHKKLDTAKTSHAHAARFTSDGLFVADLGLDAVKRYQLKDEKFIPHGQPSLNMISGAGPRHFEFGKDGKFLYVINELNSTVTVFKRSEEETYEKVEAKSTLADNFAGESFCADIHISEDGKFLYGSNRGENTIVIFKIDAQTGKLALVGREEVRGDWPRNFGIDPSGKFLLVANQKSDNISVFKRDQEMGTLAFINEIQLSSPVCLEFLK